MMVRPRTSPPLSRPPLEEITNSSSSGSSFSPTYPTAKSHLPNLRRKLSLHAFHPHVDSSEEIPSTHSSIYEASLIPSTEDIPWPNIPSTTKIGDWDNSSAELKKPPRRKLTHRKTALAPPSASPRRNYNVHYPHFLETIKEQRSIATLRSSLSLKSIRKQSFSLPTSPLAPISSTARLPSPTPLTTIPPSSHPINPPPHRSPTPDGLPAFNTPEAANYRLPPPRLRFRDFFRSITEAERQWRMQTTGLPAGVVMRGENGILVHGRFHPPNFGRSMERHPWVRGQAGPGLGGKERVEAGEQVTTMRAIPSDVRERGDAGGEEENKWKRWWETGCFVCCGAEKEKGDEAEGVRRVEGREVGGERVVATGPFS